MAVKDKEKKYQWKKGDRFGDVVIFDKKDGDFTYFTDGSRVFNNVLSEFLEPFEGDALPFPPTTSAGNAAQENPQPANTAANNQTDSTLKNLIQRLSKNNNIDLNLNVQIKIPKREFIDLFESKDELEDIIGAITQEALSEIEINKIQLNLQTQITSLIKDYYGIKS